MRFISSTLTMIIMYHEVDIFIKTHGHVSFFKYPILVKYSLRRLYHTFVWISGIQSEGLVVSNPRTDLVEEQARH